MKNMTLSIDVNLLDKQLCQLCPGSNLKGRSLMHIIRA